MSEEAAEVLQTIVVRIVPEFAQLTTGERVRFFAIIAQIAESVRRDVGEQLS